MRDNTLGLAAGLVLVGGLAVFAYCLLVDKQSTVAKINDEQLGEVCVVGESKDRLEEWSIGLFWRQSNGPWFGYFLDRQVPLWKHVRLERRTGNTIVIRLDEKDV